MINLDLLVRKAEFTDAADIANIHIRSWEAAYADIIPTEAIAERSAKRPEMWKKILSEDNDCYIALLDDTAIGLLCLNESSDNDIHGAGEISGIYLHPDYYRKGCGTKLMDFALKTLKSRGFAVITLWVLEDNFHARNFYEKCGFSFDGARKEIVIGKPLFEIRYSIMFYGKSI